MRTIVITQQPITDQKITIKVPEVAQALMRRRKLELRLNGAAANRSFASISIRILLFILFYFIFYYFFLFGQVVANSCNSNPVFAVFCFTSSWHHSPVSFKEPPHVPSLHFVLKGGLNFGAVQNGERFIYIYRRLFLLFIAAYCALDARSPRSIFVAKRQINYQILRPIEMSRNRRVVANWPRKSQSCSFRYHLKLYSSRLCSHQVGKQPALV